MSETTGRFPTSAQANFRNEMPDCWVFAGDRHSDVTVTALWERRYGSAIASYFKNSGVAGQEAQ